MPAVSISHTYTNDTDTNRQRANAVDARRTNSFIDGLSAPAFIQIPYNVAHARQLSVQQLVDMRCISNVCWGKNIDAALQIYYQWQAIIF